MATKTYKCTNYGDCDLALNKEIVEIEDGQDVICPGCSKNTLVATDSKAAGSKKGPAGKLIVIGAAVVLIIVLAVMFWPRPPDPALANTMLSEFFPKLPK